MPKVVLITQIYQDSSFPSATRQSALNISQFVGFQDSPNLSKIEKVAETCEFDGKEPLFVERTIAISIRVLGSPYLFSNFGEGIYILECKN